MKYYKLDGQAVGKAITLLEWAEWTLTADRNIARTIIGSRIVVTFFNGIDYDNPGHVMPPLLFETGVSTGGDVIGQWRTATWGAAEKAHLEICAALLAFDDGENQSEVALRAALRAVKLKQGNEGSGQ
ncbi:hypothetical protein B0G84_5715 [Paraburkholderia sp. BL8N3]|nr:hypothetical protein [Paraburkholderia sp. BL8N3]TCK36702.1 hypothetical protein B0G84_5715 [Paraburkholderia sp. BL8N3]